MRPIRSALLVASACALIGLPACQGHGKYTTQALEDATQRMSSIQAGTRWDLAHQQFLAGDLKKALKNVETSIELHDAVAQSHVLHGRILMELGQLEQSIVAFDNAIEIDPSTADPFYYRGIVFERFSEYVEAHESFETASQLEPSDPQYTIAAAEMLIQLDLLDQAEQTLLERSSHFQHNAGIKQTLGHIALLNNNPKLAVDYFSEARLLASSNLSVVEDLVSAQMLAGLWVEAEFNLRTLLNEKDHADRRDLKQLQARCLVALERPVEARSLLLDLTNTPSGASDATVWIDLGKVALTLGDDRRVKLCATRITAIAPHRHEGYMLSAALDMRADNYEQALVSLTIAADIATTDPRPAMLKGVVLQQLGRHDEATESFAQALRVSPQDTRAKQLIANVPLDD